MRSFCQYVVVTILLSTISLAVQAQSVATVRVSPERPRAGETVYAIYTTPRPCMSQVNLPGEVRLDNNTFTIRYSLRTNLSAPCDTDVRTVTELGRLPQGNFRVVAAFDTLPSPPFTISATATRAEAEFSVQPRLEELAPVNNVSGMWYDSSDPGWALTLYQQSDNRLLGTWATYDAEGVPTWFFLLPGRWVEEGIYEAPIGEAAAGPFFRRANPALPIVPSVSVVGSARLLFNDGSPVEAGGQFTYTVYRFTTSRVLEHFVY